MKLDFLEEYPSLFQMSLNEIIALQNFAEETSGDVLEIGMGGSTIIFLNEMRGSSRRITSIDVKDKLEICRKDIPESYLQKLTFIQEMSNNVEFHPTKTFETMFIDGNHDYDWVKHDVLRYWHNVEEYLLFHDYSSSYGGVVDFVDTLLRAGFLEVVNRCETLLLTRKVY